MDVVEQENVQVESESKESGWSGWLKSKSISNVVSIDNEESDIYENPWISAKVLDYVNEYILYENGITYRISESEGQQDKPDTEEIKENEIDYLVYEEPSVDTIEPYYGFVRDIDLDFQSDNAKSIISSWDKSKNYLFGIICGYKQSEDITNQYGSYVIKAFNAEELSEYLPCNLSLEEQAEYCYDNIHFNSGVRVSENLYPLYKYIYEECGFTFVPELKIIEKEDINKDKTEEVEEVGSFIIESIDKEKRTVSIRFV